MANCLKEKRIALIERQYKSLKRKLEKLERSGEARTIQKSDTSGAEVVLDEALILVA